ncbi:MAG: DUF1501 domain-containing protein [Verrucomicrobiales bacterium]|nr:DUF1501 domain-containing protein [Verrucomicrobiales bacterium]
MSIDDFASMNRRRMLRRAGAGFGMVALQHLLLRTGMAGSVRREGGGTPHFAPRAKAIIWLFMNGGQSQVDTWDYKPELQRRDGQALPDFDPKTGFFPGAVGPLMKSPFDWAQHGQSGTWVSSLFPHLSKQVDRMAFIHSLHTESNNHSPALFMMNTGTTRMGHPSVGSWITYGLGSVSDDLPAFIVMSDPKDRGLPKGHASNWTAGFLPGVFQGTWLKPKGEPMENLRRPGGLGDGRQRAQLDLLEHLNRLHMAQSPVEDQLAARIDSFELAYRMQSAAPEAFDLSREPESVRRLYGLDQAHCAPMAAQCLMARRLVERGTRFVQIYSGGMDNQLSWDGHEDIVGNHGGFALETDQPFAALLVDLAQRGLLEDTLVVCGGEFGRLPIAQKSTKPGRDHNPHALTVWMAGGGVRGGTHYGETDEIGYRAMMNKVSIRDFHATLLYALGIDHERLTYRFQGLDQRLTGVESAHPVRELFT